MEKIIGPQGAECYRISHSSGAEVTIALHGGHVISWKTADGIERLYLSDRAEFQAGKAIRGGVPVIFPQFNENGPYGRHGFARKSEWIADTDTGLLKLVASETTRAIWPFDFELSIGIELSPNSLEIQLAVKNTGGTAFPFQAALHTYFKTSDVCETTVDGLESLLFENEVTNQTETGESDGIRFGTKVDRAYVHSGDHDVTMQTAEPSEALQISSDHFPDFVVWNPGPNHGIGDLPAEGWLNFVCVESAQVQNGEPLEPGEKWIGAQKIRAVHVNSPDNS